MNAATEKILSANKNSIASAFNEMSNLWRASSDCCELRIPSGTWKALGFASKPSASMERMKGRESILILFRQPDRCHLFKSSGKDEAQRKSFALFSLAKVGVWTT